MTKIENAGITNTELKVWCEHCSIRIAPNEEQTVVRENTYHLRCCLKLPADSQAESMRFGSRWALGRSSSINDAEFSNALLEFNREAVVYCHGISDTLARDYALEFFHF